MEGYKVLNDANLDEAGKAIAFGALAHSGQVCTIKLSLCRI